jgi:hypothetical protein
MADDLKRVVDWKCHLIDGPDYCALWHTAEGWLLKARSSESFTGLCLVRRGCFGSFRSHALLSHEDLRT